MEKESLKKETKIIKCPVCKSENISDNSPRTDNGIIGSGFTSWKILDIRCCDDCGIVFKPIKGNGL